MKTAGKKKEINYKSSIHNECSDRKTRQDNENTYKLYADAPKCFDKLWLKDSLIEMERIGYHESITKGI